MHWSVFARAAVMALMFSALVAAPVSAQITTGTVAGSVKDDQGLAVPGASVTLVSEARGTRMAPGRHQRNRRLRRAERDPRHLHGRGRRCRASSPSVRPGVAVSGGDRISVGELTLSLGVTSRDRHRVKSEAPLIQSQSGERSFRVTTAEVENLPIGTGRNFATLTSLTPGVVGQRRRGSAAAARTTS